MKKDDYRSDFEEDRQKINLDDEPTVIKTRAELYKKNRRSKKKSSNVMINITFTLFTLIPVVIIAFFLINWYVESNKNTTAAQGSLVKYETRENQEKDDDSSGNGLDDKEDTEKVVEKDEEDKKDNSITEKPPEETVQKKPKEKVESKDKPIEKTVVEPKEKVEEKVEEKPVVKTHTVSPKETLYSISVIHYQSGKGVERIKQANGITTNEIYVGQVLVIP